MDEVETGAMTIAGLQLDSLRLGASSEELETGSRVEVAGVAQRLASQAQRLLLLHTENLAPEIYDRPGFLDAIRRFARLHNQTRFLILVHDSRRAVQRGHRLIELGRQLSSTIEFRRPMDEYRHFHESFLLADTTGYLHRRLPARYEGTASFNAPGKAADWQKYFMEVWDRSEPDLELKRLYL
jgi:hypothetical protein